MYAPNNAVLVLSGDFEVNDAKKWVDQYFSPIPAASLPQKPDISEPAQDKEKKFTKEDKLANKPAIAIAYKMPDRNTPAYYAMGLIDQLLLQGNDSRLNQSLVQEKGYTGNVTGGINYLGNMFDYNGPMVWMANLIYDAKVNPDSIIDQFDKAVSFVENNVTQKNLDLAVIKMRSSIYDALGTNFGIGKVNLLASFALFDDNPSKINELENEFKKVTPELIKKTAKDYLRPGNRTILIIDPKAAK